MKRLQDKVVIMTGAAGGICGEASKYFCKEGAKVVMVDKNPLVREICEGIVADKGEAIAVVADVSKRDTWEGLLKTTLEKYGTVDCVVNGAAEFYNRGDAWDVKQFSEEVWTPASADLYHEETAMPWFRSIIPTPPHYAPASAPAPLMAFLASDEAYWINGVCIPIDGGWNTCN